MEVTSPTDTIAEEPIFDSRFEFRDFAYDSFSKLVFSVSSPINFVFKKNSSVPTRSSRNRPIVFITSHQRITYSFATVVIAGSLNFKFLLISVFLGLHFMQRDKTGFSLWLHYSTVVCRAKLI